VWPNALLARRSIKRCKDVRQVVRNPVVQSTLELIILQMLTNNRTNAKYSFLVVAKSFQCVRFSQASPPSTGGRLMAYSPSGAVRHG
jgi:hypothetical protein